MYKYPGVFFRVFFLMGNLVWPECLVLGEGEAIILHVNI